jgi:histidyl-tRNA synthetase
MPRRFAKSRSLGRPTTDIRVANCAPGLPRDDTVSMKFQAIKGVRDILPPESALWNRVEQAARGVFHSYGYGEIRLPIFEPTELFARSVGVNTDIVSKEMYSFEDHASADLAAIRSTIMEEWEAMAASTSLHPMGFNLNVGAFVGLLTQRIEKGLVPRTPQNLEAVRQLSAYFQDLQSKSQLLSSDVAHVKDILRRVQLGDEVTLRPEATASVVRAYIEHGMHTRPGNVKLYYIGPMFRRERPQKGRYRQFHQIGAELLGLSDHAALDAEVIEMLLAFFARVNLTGAKLYINSIGDKNCRPAYVERLRGELQKVREKLGADSQRRIETNPLRVLDS